MGLINLDTKFVFDDFKASFPEALDIASVKLDELKKKRCPGAEWTGWWNYPKLQGYRLAKEINDWVALNDQDYDTILTIGIGGSYLGTRAVYEALNHQYEILCSQNSQTPPKRPLLLFAGHHLSGRGLRELIDLLHTRNVLVNVISKSGTTTEPAVAFRIIRSALETKYGKNEIRSRIIVTTDPQKGALRQLANEYGYKTFDVPSDIGGRFSVLSAVGLVPLALCKFDIMKMMEGADKIFDELCQNINDHPVLQYASARFIAHTRQKKQIEVLSYSDPKLNQFVEWWKQLFGESEGKNHKGLFPVGLCLTTDLHSLGQYVQDGVRNIFETFLVFKDLKSNITIPTSENNLDELSYLEGKSIEEINHAAMKATKIAHFDGGVPCVEIEAQGEINEFSLGALFAFFESACAVSALMLGLNPFDQPGVEGYKRNLFGLMNKPGFEAIGEKIHSRLE